MKSFVLFLCLSAVSTAALADLVKKHQSMCEKVEGSCRVVIAPKKVEKQGVCMGVFMETLPCFVTYISVKEGAAMNITCGADADNPLVNEDLEAEAVAYNVAAIIQKTDGTIEVVNDKNNYLMLISRMVELDLTGAGTISVLLQDGPVALTDVRCL